MKEEISTYRSTIVSRHRKAFESRTPNFIFRTNETTVYSKGFIHRKGMMCQMKFRFTIFSLEDQHIRQQ